MRQPRDIAKMLEAVEFVEFNDMFCPKADSDDLDSSIPRIDRTNGKHGCRVIKEAPQSETCLKINKTPIIRARTHLT